MRQNVCWHGSTFDVVSKRSKHTEHSNKSFNVRSSMALRYSLYSSLNYYCNIVGGTCTTCRAAQNYLTWHNALARNERLFIGHISFRWYSHFMIVIISILLRVNKCELILLLFHWFRSPFVGTIESWYLSLIRMNENYRTPIST